MKQLEESFSNLFGNKAAAGAAVLVFRVVVGLIILWIGSRLINWICKIILRSLQKNENTDKGVVSFLNSVLKVVLYLILVLLILNGFGYNTASLLTLLGSFGLAVVLGLKDSLSNVASGIMIMLLKPFAVDDYIIEDTNHNEGTVIDIGLFFTRLQTLDKKTIVLPNQMLTTNSVTNVTMEKQRMLEISYSVSYGSDLDQVKDVIRDVISHDKDTIKPEEIHIFVQSLGDSAVVVASRSKVLNENYWQTRFRLMENIYKAFMENGIEFAYPQLDVHLKRQ